ncbi:MAG: Bug family tripartite tricarboxylate transporter substrate binding protein [Burkholderiales bacterium]
MTRYTPILIALLAALAPAAAQAAESYPSRPVRFIVPYPPGGTTDLVTRGIANKLSETYGQQFVTDNRGGASTIIGADLLAKASPDGHTIGLLTQTTMSINPNVVKKLPYDAAKDYAPITQTVYVPFMIAAHPSLPVKSVPELIALAKSKPGSISYGTPGTASTNHLGGALLEHLAGIKLLHVPFKGSGPATNATLGGQVNFVITGISTVTPHAKAGRINILAIAAEKRHPNWPDIPSTGEAGLKGYKSGTWFGVLAPAGTPRAVVASLHKNIAASLEGGELKKRLTAIGFDVVTQSPQEFAKFMKEDRALTAKIIKAAGIKLN